MARTDRSPDTSTAHCVCDINPAALDWFDQIPTVTRKVSDYTDLLSDDAIDALYIAVRHDLHQQLYVDTIQAGKSLHAGKPFGIDGSAAAASSSAAAANPSLRAAGAPASFEGFSRARSWPSTTRGPRPGRDHRGLLLLLHASDLDVGKPINWKRQARYCGEAGVMRTILGCTHGTCRCGSVGRGTDLVLQDTTERPTPNGGRERCDTWDNAVLHGWVSTDSYSFPLTTEMKGSTREKNT